MCSASASPTREISKGLSQLKGFVKIFDNSGLQVPNHLFLVLTSKHYNSVGQIQVTFTHTVQGRVEEQLTSSSPVLYIHGAFCSRALLQEGLIWVKLLGHHGFGATCLLKAQNNCKTATLNSLSSLQPGPSVNHRICSCWHH